jgi:hypothetical protein
MKEQVKTIPLIIFKQMSEKKKDNKMMESNSHYRLAQSSTAQMKALPRRMKMTVHIKKQVL